MNERLSQYKEQLQQQWRSQVLQHANVQQAMQWYGNKSLRDQRILKALAAVVLLLLVWLLFFAPLLHSHKTAKAELNSNLATYNLMASNAGRFGHAGASANQNTSLLAAATNQARSNNLNLSRYEQDGVNLRVWLERAAFDDAITWLENLQSQYGISANQISIDKTDTIGRVDIRATLTR